MSKKKNGKLKMDGSKLIDCMAEAEAVANHLSGRYALRLGIACRKAGRHQLALGFFSVSVMRGCQVAHTQLGNVYRYGEAVPQDYLRARDHYLLGAAAWDPEAFERLGEMYSYGQGFEKDYIQAHAWFLLGVAEYLARGITDGADLNRVFQWRYFIAGAMSREEFAKSFDWAKEYVSQQMVEAPQHSHAESNIEETLEDLDDLLGLEEELDLEEEEELLDLEEECDA